MAGGTSLAQLFPYMNHRFEGLVGVCGTDDDGLGTFQTGQLFHDRQTASLSCLVCKDEQPVMVTCRDGLFKSLSELFGDDYLLLVHSNGCRCPVV